MRAAIYARVSSTDQAGLDKISISDQIDRCRTAATEEGFDVPDELIFVDAGESGVLDENERPGYGRVLIAAQQHRFEKLFFWKTDRFARDAAVALNGFRALTNAGIAFTSVGEPGATENPLLRTMLAGMAEAEHQAIKQRTVPARRRRRDQGYWGGGAEPYGYVKTSEGTLRQCEFEAPVLRRIFELAQSTGTSNISKRLNAEAIPPTFALIEYDDGPNRRFRIRSMDRLIDHLRKTTGKLVNKPTWTAGSIRQILANPVCAGELHVTESDGRTKTSTRPVLNEDGTRKIVHLIIDDGPIVSKSEFEASREIRGRRKFQGSGRQRNYLLTGLVRCGNPSCETAYKHVGSINRSWNYYVCTRKAEAGDCTNWNVRAREANYFVIRELADYLMQQLSADMIVERVVGAPRRREEAISVDIREAQREANDLRQERRRHAARLLAADLAENDVPEVGDKLRELARRIELLEERETSLVRELATLRERLTLDEQVAELQAEKAMLELLQWDHHQFVYDASFGEAPQLLVDVANAVIDGIVVHSLRGYPDRDFSKAASTKQRVGELHSDVEIDLSFKDPAAWIPEVVRLLAGAELKRSAQHNEETGIDDLDVNGALVTCQIVRQKYIRRKVKPKLGA